MNTRELCLSACREHDAIQDAGELAALVGLLPPVNRALEVGVHRGGTMWLWGQVAEDDALLLGIDVDVSRADRVYARPGQRMMLFEQDSAVARPWVELRLGGEKLDFLFIDGDHEREVVLNDFALYSPLVREGGVIALHDVAEQAGPAWHELLQEYLAIEVRAVKPGWGIPTADDYPGYGSRLGIGVIFK